MGAAIAPIERTFGPYVLTNERGLDRAKMRHLIFTDPTARAALESIVHPLVQREMLRQTELAEERGIACIVLDIPLLVESQFWRSKLHRILVVDCSEPTQIARVSQRDGIASAEIAQILTAQAPRTQRLQAADLVLFNDGISLVSLAAQVQQMGAQFGL